MTNIRPCKVCGHPLEEEDRWDLETCYLWIEDCNRWIGEILHGDHIHWCYDWDSLPVDETSNEYSSCTCRWTD